MIYKQINLLSVKQNYKFKAISKIYIIIEQQQMKVLILLTILCSLTVTLRRKQIIFASNTTNTVIISPKNTKIAQQPYWTSAYPRDGGTQWLWEQDSPYPDQGQTQVLIFQSHFYSNCNGKTTLSIEGDDVFSAVLNGGKAMIGEDFLQVYEFDLVGLKCGLNTLTTTVTNSGGAGAISYTIRQDQSTCFKCPSQQTYIKKICKCQTILCPQVVALKSRNNILFTSNTTNTVIISPSTATIAQQSYYKETYTIEHNGAQWLWDSQISWSAGKKKVLVFQSHFYSSCNGNTSLLIRADDHFSAVLNGGKAMTGDYLNLHTFDLVGLKCGLNTLITTVTNTGGPGAVTYTITQDQSTCFNCPASQTYVRQTCKCNVLLLTSNPANTIIAYPPTQAVIQPQKSSSLPDFIGDGAQWIWEYEQTSWPQGKTKILNFQTLFYSSCNGETTLQISADNQFSVYLNGGKEMTGNNSTLKYFFILTGLKCGMNTLTTTVTNTGGLGGLSFKIAQDQSTCFKCDQPQTYYPNLCSCHKCPARTQICPSTKTEWSHSLCECVCKTFTICPYSRIWNQKKCECVSPLS